MKSMTGTVLGALLLTGLTAPVYAAGEETLAQAAAETAAEEAFVKHAEKDLKHAMKDLKQAEEEMNKEMAAEKAAK